MLGTKAFLQVVIADTDAIIASLYQGDASFPKAKQVAESLAAHGARLVFPITTIAETITTLIRKLNQPAIAQEIVKQIKDGDLLIEAADTRLLSDALAVFNPTSSKQRTIFDAMVAATAKKLKTPYIFSFDEWYKKLGFTLVSDFIEESPKADKPAA